MVKALRIIRKFERFHFQGIPEQPEHTWERDGHAYIEMRETGKPQSSQSSSASNADGISLGTLTYNFKEDKVEIAFSNNAAI